MGGKDLKAWVLHDIGDIRYEEIPVPEPAEASATRRSERSSDPAVSKDRGSGSEVRFWLLPGEFLQEDSSGAAEEVPAPAECGFRRSIFQVHIRQE